MIARGLLFLVLIALWLCNFPFGLISTYVGAHFPWPEARPWKLAALLSEHTVIEALATMPFAVLIAFAFPKRGIWIAAALCVIFWGHLLRDHGSVAGRPSATIFVTYMALSHFVCLVGGTALVGRLRSQQLKATTAEAP
jgi:hypothetical protein